MKLSRVNHLTNGATQLNEGTAIEDEALELLERSLQHYAGRIALVSSFGAESALLLHLVSRIDRSLPIIFVDTLMLFKETLAYQSELSETFGLTDVRHVRADTAEILSKDRFSALHLSDPDACCDLRKVRPLLKAMSPFTATITGRKRYQSATRSELENIEMLPDGQIKINPVASWDRDHIRSYFGRYNLPAHPLVNSGFPSIGCLPCTTMVKDGEDSRAGRWRGVEKIECGIHLQS